jgi:acetyltransferase-like isoleucine patch superfamily enzyme
VQLYGDTFLQTGWGGALSVGAGTHIQPGCHIHACVSDISIGQKAEIAACCALYSYDHGFVSGKTIMDQPLQSEGPIVVGDGVWLGHGAIVLSGVNIGEGAVIGAGSVVSRHIPANAIAAGSPARVIKMRTGTAVFTN